VVASSPPQYLTFFNVDQDVFGGASDRFFGFKNPYRLAYVEEFAQLDLRDRALEPRYGGYLSLRLEEGDPAVGSDFHYVKATPEVRAYLPLGRRAVLAGRALTGWIKTYGGEESPITRRFRLGGPADHRGFGFGRLSPQARDQQGRLIPYGGDGEVLFSGELRADVTKIGGSWLALIPFVDAGDVAPTYAELDLRRLHVATGLDGAYSTAIGVLRAGVAVRLNRLGPGDPDPGDRWAFHITIGEAF
jgi:outer membrane protein assembly factor BamA